MHNIYIYVSKSQDVNERNMLKWIEYYMECYRLIPKDIVLSFFSDDLSDWPLTRIKCIVEHLEDSISEAILPQKFCIDNDFIHFAKDAFIDLEAGSPFVKVSLDSTIFQDYNALRLWQQNISSLTAQGILVRVNILLDCDFIDVVSPEMLVRFLKAVKIDDIDFLFTADTTTINRFDKWLNDFYFVNSGYAYVVLFNSIKDGRYFTQRSAVIESDQTITLRSGPTEIRLTIHDALTGNCNKEQSNVGCYICDLHPVCLCLSYQSNEGCLALKRLINTIITTEG